MRRPPPNHGTLWLHSDDDDDHDDVICVCIYKHLLVIELLHISLCITGHACRSLVSRVLVSTSGLNRDVNYSLMTYVNR